MSEIETQCIPYVCALHAVEQSCGFGSKAHNLARMQRLGFPVYDGFIVSDRAFQEFLDDNDLRSRIDELCQFIELTDHGSLRQISQQIRSLVLTAVLPASILKQMTEHWEKLLPGKTLIVRSSAVGEDSPQASFAGQLDSILHVDSAQQLATALLECWASYWSDRSIFYQRSRGVSLNGMGVLIQEQAKPEYSGVLFTMNPDGTSEGKDSMVIEFCPGFGGALVSGEITPSRVVVQRSDPKRFHVVEQPEVPTHALRLDDAVIQSLIQWGFRLEELFGSPQDVEWTQDENGQIILLQSRHISVPLVANPLVRSGFVASMAVGCEITADPMGTTSMRSVLWSNANVNENFPEPISPLLYSVAAEGYYHYFRNLGHAAGLRRSRLDAMKDSLRHIIGVHGARMYYNLSSIHSCLRMAPYGDRLTELFNHFVGADQIAARDDRPDWQQFQCSRTSQFAELCRIVMQVACRAVTLTSGVTRFESTVDDFAAMTQPETLQTKSSADLLTHLRQFMDIRCNRWVKASLADAAAMISYGLLRRHLSTEFPEEDLSSLHNTLLKGLPELASSKPITALWEFSRFIQQDPKLTQLFAEHESHEILQALELNPEFFVCRQMLADYLGKYGFRCSGELMLTVPSFQEDPSALIPILRAYVLLTSESPADRLHEQDRQRKQETARILNLLNERSWFRFLPCSFKALKARTLLTWTQRSIALRERARMKQALLYSRLRRIVLTIGDQLVSRKCLENRADIFFMSFREIDELLSGSSMFPQSVPEMVRLRKAAHQMVSRQNPPDTFELAEGEYFTGNVESSSIESEDDNRSSSASSLQLTGVGACGGCITATAAVLRDVSEFSLLQQGDVLVTRQTDPGWGPLFFLIRGLVIERGGMLSHGAILAREFGIPTVVGVADATQKISRGQIVTVNGDRGIVQISAE